MAEQQNIITMPALALRGLVVYPRMMVHFDVGREMSIKALEEAMSNNQPVFLVAQKDIRVEAPGKSHLYTMGTVAVVRQILRLPARSVRVMVEGQYRAKMQDLIQTDPYLTATVERVEHEDAILVRSAKLHDYDFPAELKAILVTHEHADHISGVGVLSRRYHLPVYASLGTWAAMSGKVDGAFWAITSAFGTALTTFVGQNYGAGKLDRIRACAKKSLLLMTAMTLSVSGILLLIARPLLHLLTNDGAVIDTTWYIILLFVPFYLIWVPIEVFSGVLRGVGDVLTPSLILAGGICGFRILWLLTAFNLSHTLLTLCICYPLSWVVTDVAIYLYFRRSPVMTRAVRVIDSDYDHKTR